MTKVRIVDSENYVPMKKIRTVRDITKPYGKEYKGFFSEMKGKWDIDSIVQNKSYQKPKKLKVFSSKEVIVGNIDGRVKVKYAKVRIRKIKVLKVMTKSGKLKYYAHINDAMGEQIV